MTLTLDEIFQTQVVEVRKTLADEIQIGGDHYKKLAIQPWDYVHANHLGYFEGCIIKYITRWRVKGGVEDLKKARHFLDKLIEVSTDTDDM